MSKKNKGHERFNNPFSALEGLAVSGEQLPAAKKAAQPNKELPIEADRSEEQTDEVVDFDEVMSGLGVKEIDRDGLEMRALSPDEAPKLIAPVGVDVTEKSDSAGNRVARARRDKQLRRGDIQPQAELDLHGVKADEVAQKVAWFIENAVFHGFEAVRIITGKGLRSVDGPVLRPLVESYLDGPGRKWVVEWIPAPQRQGGDGAIVAFLRSG